MKKFKNSLVVLAGLTTLVLAIPLLMPLVGLGSNTSGGSAPTNQTQNVNVVNVPTVNAQQSGTWNVGINGTPTVSIDGTNNTVKIDGSSRVPVRDVDNPARNAFVFFNSGVYAANAPNVSFNFAVPAGKRIVIEQVSVSAELNQAVDQKLKVFVSGQSNGANTGFIFTGQDAGTAGIYEDYVASSQMRTYVDGPNSVFVGVGRNDTSANANSADIYLSGYLIDIP